MVELNDKTKYLKPIKSKVDLNNLKSNYFLEKLFNNLKKNKYLVLIKYNKRIQNRLNINNKDYKEFSEIEIEIITFKNIYGKFINISNKEEESYYHIYFNDNKNEIKRNYLTENDNITKIKIIIDYQIKSFENLFKDCKVNESIILKNFIEII